MAKIKLAALDVDGTLIRRDLSLSKAVEQALQSLHDGLPDQVHQQWQGVLQDRRCHLYRMRRSFRFTAVRGCVPVRLYQPGLTFISSPGACHVRHPDRIP